MSLKKTGCFLRKEIGQVRRSLDKCDWGAVALAHCGWTSSFDTPFGANLGSAQYRRHRVEGDPRSCSRGYLGDAVPVGRKRGHHHDCRRG